MSKNDSDSKSFLECLKENRQTTREKQKISLNDMCDQTDNSDTRNIIKSGEKWEVRQDFNHLPVIEKLIILKRGKSA